MTQFWCAWDKHPLLHFIWTLKLTLLQMLLLICFHKSADIYLYAHCVDKQKMSLWIRKKNEWQLHATYILHSILLNVGGFFFAFIPGDYENIFEIQAIKIREEGEKLISKHCPIISKRKFLLQNLTIRNHSKSSWNVFILKCFGIKCYFLLDLNIFHLTDNLKLFLLISIDLRSLSQANISLL